MAGRIVGPLDGLDGEGPGEDGLPLGGGLPGGDGAAAVKGVGSDSPELAEEDLGEGARGRAGWAWGQTGEGTDGW